MDYKEIKLTVSNDGVKEYKLFEGAKLYSSLKEIENGKYIISQRVYQTKKKNYVYYQRTDVNWNFWSTKENLETNFIPEKNKNR
ncbi:EXLDI protein [Granulicatella seriolae]|uniref:EXLDI protein n=1 Tax=Granulicatella seriolae TaxID=2967226 RepID=A0ABT1WQN1_9LACT|nr:EXLDI protein [Granulicatella seriolae]